jgi:hypothetical protein
MRKYGFAALVCGCALALQLLLGPLASASPAPSNQTINTLWQFNLAGGLKQTETFSTSIAIKGLWGPIPQDDPGLSYLLKVHDPGKDDGSAPMVSGKPVVLPGWQRQGGPVRVEVHCPTVEQLGVLRAKTQKTRYFFRPTKRFINFRLVRRDDFYQNDFEQKISFKADNKTGIATWTPVRHVHKNGRVRSMAPVVIEVTVTYQGMHGLEVDGNPKANWEKKTHVKRRVGWLVLPVCGNTYGDHMASCPAAAGPTAKWQNRAMGDLSLAVPDTWTQRLAPDKVQGSWEYDDADPPSAALLLLRDKPDQLLAHMKLDEEKQLTLNGLAVKMYHGRVEVKKAESRLYVLAERDAAGKPVLLAAISADWDRYGPLLEACMNSLQKGDAANMPEASPDPPGPEGGPLEYSAQAVSSKPPEDQAPVIMAADQPDTDKDAKDSGGPKEPVKLSYEDQKALAKKLFTKLTQTPTHEYGTFEKLYQEVMQRCPDTIQAETSYWRLSNLYVMGYEPPKLNEAVELLEQFLKRYPKSDGAPQVKERLVSLYERTEKWCKAAGLYGEMFPVEPERPDPEAVPYYVSYADALDKCGKPGQARAWYALAVKGAKDKQSFIYKVAKESLDRLDGQSGGAQGGQPEAAGLKVRLDRKRRYADFAGRGESVGANGSADTRFIMLINAPGTTITALSLSSLEDQKVLWDTTAGNQTWLLIMARKNKVLNQADGSIKLTLPEGEQKYDLWVQDNNSIAGGKTKFQLRITFDQGESLECQVSDPAAAD